MNGIQWVRWNDTDLKTEELGDTRTHVPVLHNPTQIAHGVVNN
jgi:hypothetical protein